MVLGIFKGNPTGDGVSLAVQLRECSKACHFGLKDDILNRNSGLCAAEHRETGHQLMVSGRQRGKALYLFVALMNSWRSSRR